MLSPLYPSSLCSALYHRKNPIIRHIGVRPVLIVYFERGPQRFQDFVLWGYLMSNDLGYISDLKELLILRGYVSWHDLYGTPDICLVVLPWNSWICVPAIIFLNSQNPTDYLGCQTPNEGSQCT